jgi:citronellol/citronellal dehydrogenase
MSKFKGKTAFITGASRGIGKAIGLKLAQEGANIVIAAKTAAPHPKLAGTIFTAAEEMEQAGGKALPLVVDVRNEEEVKNAVDKTIETFGGIDILVNNASAIQLTGTLQTDMKRYDLMHQINTRGTFMTSKYCIPHLLNSDIAHVLNLAPPLNMETRWFAPHVAYTMAKFGMSMCVLGMAGEFKGKIAFNALWPKTLIATAAVDMLNGEAFMNKSRKVDIMADCAHLIFSKAKTECTGNFFVDEELLRAEGISDFSQYAYIAGTKDEDLLVDFFV